MAYNPKRIFNTVSGHDYSQAAFLVNPSDPIAQMIRNTYLINQGLLDENGRTEEEKKEEEQLEQARIASLIDNTIQSFNFAYDTPEFNAYNGFIDSKQWQDFSDPIYTRAYDMRETTLLRDEQGMLYVPKQDKDGNTTYFKVTEQGLIEAPDVEPVWMQRITRETGSDGEVVLYANGRILDPQTTTEILTTLKEHGEDVAATTHTQKDMADSQVPAMALQEIEDKQWKAEISLNSANEKLAQNYTKDNFINREQADIELKIANAELAHISGSPESADKDIAAAQKMREDLIKLEKLKTELAGKSPDEANRIMTAAFGSKYDVILAQQATANQQPVAATIPALTTGTGTSRALGSYANRLDPADPNKQTSSIAFNSAANNETPAAATPTITVAPAAKQQALGLG